LAWVLCGLAALLCDRVSLAADKNGVSPNAISLPKGPGAIEGLGESFQPHLNTGTASFSVALKFPPGTAGHTPSFGLSYEGGSGNGPLGFGWTLPMSSIQLRTDEGIPTYGENVGFPRCDTFINDIREELVPLTNGFLFCKNEGAFIRYQQLSNYWVGTLPNGTRMEFGLTPEARIQDPTNPDHIFSWLLQKETDTHGNVIVYSYTNFPDANNLNQKYLAGIAYGPGAPPWNNFHFVSLIYEDRPDWFEDCRSGFVVRTGKRLKQVLAGTQGPVLTNHLAGDFNDDGLTDYLDRKYVLDYLNYAGTNTHWSLLSKVTELGADGTSSLPPATYGYVVSDPPDTLSAAGQLIGGLNEPLMVMDNPAVDFLDLNGDGLPDVLVTDPSGGIHTAYINQGQTNSGSGAAIQWLPGVTMESADGRAPQFGLQSTAPIAHLADMDGDGLADLAVTALDGSVLYFRNSGHLGWGPRQEMSIQDTAPPSPFGNPDVRTADLDFDKRMDIIQSISTGSGADYRIWFNLGNQAYSAAITVPQASGFMFSTPGVQIADFNGDRVPDIAQINPAFVSVTAGLGYGRFAAPLSVPIPDLVLDDFQVARATLMDINGDGLADLVLERAAPGELWYWLNLGNYTFSHRKVITGLPSGLGPNAVVRWADINGNGTVDLVYADSTATPRMQAVDIGLLVNNGATPNLLVRTANGIGRVATVNYQSSTTYALADAAAGQPWPDLMPNPVQVVASVTTLDSLGHQYVTQFRYHNGYYDPVQKQFRGFAEADQIDIGEPSAPTLVTRSFFDTGRVYEAMKGKLLALSIEQQDGEVFSVATNLWANPPVTLYTGSNGTNVMYAHPTGTVKIITELGQGTPRRLESEMAYDNYGNQTTNADYGIVVSGDRAAFSDERITTTEYAINTNLWLLHHPARQQIKDYNGNVISQVESYYDDETFSGNNFGLVTVGNLTLSRAWIVPSNATAYIKVGRTQYDTYGNRTTLLDPLAVASGGGVDLSQGHVRQISYDSRFHAYPVSETIHIGGGSQPLVYQAFYDEGFGTLTACSDFNTNVTAYGYDAFVRLINIVRPNDTMEYPTTEYDYALAIPFGTNGLVNYVETRHRHTSEIVNPKSSMYLFSRQFADGLGRTLMTKTEAEAEYSNGPPRVVVSEAVQFNARQKPAVTLNPYFSQIVGADLNALLGFEDISAPGWQGTFSQSGQEANLTLAAAHREALAYDAMLREIAATNQDGTFNVTKFEPLVVRKFDENQSDPTSSFYGNSSVQYSDGLDRLIQVDEVTHLNDDGTEATTISHWSTSYQYDLNNCLTRITDSQNNVKSINYDGLKRKTFMDDPDCGRVNYVYDDAANLIQCTDAKNQLTSYSYDGANRLLTEQYHDGAAFPRWRSGSQATTVTNSVAYFYDVPFDNLPQGDNTTATAHNTRGMLAYVVDLSGEEHTSFDARGRVEYTVKRIPDPIFLSTPNAQLSIPLVSYRTSFEYDSLDRVMSMTYPDNDKITYQYDERSLLQRIPGGPNTNIIASITRTPSGQQSQIDFGNGIRTSYGYDNRLRLTTLTSVSTGSTSPLISFGYSFDPVSNIKSISDLRPISIVLANDPRRNTQNFTYDDLYRLTRVQYNLPNPASLNGGEINYRYDRIGNMLAQTSNIQHYQNGLSLTQLGDMAYGGAGGKSGRIGRGPNDPPGPHALTSASQLSTNNPQPRNFLYDPNGNMEVLDGLINIWDFKDRLIACENAQMRADYTYDYADRRVSKSVRYQSGSSPLGNDQGPITTLYIGEHFEIREHDAPAKYVFNGASRVARVTGSLSDNERIQRFRVNPGWNLCSLAVTASSALSQLSVFDPHLIQAAYQWSPAVSNWLAVTLGETLAAGAVLWLKTYTNAVLTLVGTYSEPVTHAISAGSSFLPSAGFEAWPTSGLPPNLVAWVAGAHSNRWQVQFAGGLQASSDFPAFISPGEALFVQAEGPTDVAVPPEASRIRYYHQDHLGSSSALSDAAGMLVEETAFYPFGQPRCQFEPQHAQDTYLFTQKELDKETGLQYFDRRYLAAPLGRFSAIDFQFASPDLLPKNQESEFLDNPQKLNLYAYVLNSPLVLTDPTGLEDEHPETAKELTKKQAHFVKERLEQGVIAIDAALEALQKNSPEAAAELKRWMGKTRPADKAKVVAILKETRDNLQYWIEHPKKVFNDPLCDDYAYVLDDDDKNRLFLGPDFWGKAGGHKVFDTQFGALTHEGSHPAGTEDVGLCPGLTKADKKCYGTGDAQWLVKHHPQAARRNADNYEYLVESLYSKTQIDLP
jgi:RHS repeat-associated protein